MKCFLIITKLLLISGCVTYPLPDAKLTDYEVCGLDKCSPGNFGTPLRFYKETVSPDLSESTTPEDIAYSVLGHTTKTSDASGSRVTKCSSDGISNPFSKNDIAPKTSIESRVINYTRNAKLDIDITPTVSATLEELKKQIDINDYVTELKAKIEAGYKKIDKSNATLTGLYYEWGLSDSVIQTLHTSKYNECSKYLVDNDRSLITAVGFINFYTAVDNSDFSSFIAEVNAVFQAKGVNFDVSPTVVKEVTKTLNASTKNGYQILVWRRSPAVWVE